MKILIIGSGAREHAIVRTLKLSSKVSDIFCFPGNDALFEKFNPLPSSTILKNSDLLISKLKTFGIDIVVVGPEVPLVEGLADRLRKEDILVFGPSKQAAALEGSKIYAKKFMTEANIPTAPYHVVSSKDEVISTAQRHFSKPYVLKVDGLAAGKGVYVCHSFDELTQAAQEVFEKKRFGKCLALLEEYQEGQELSYLVLTNGKEFSTLPIVQDYKPLLDGNKGPNTGGMGAIGPLNIPPSLRQEIETSIVKPTITSLHQQSIDYRGVLYIGLIITKAGPKVLEYNVRFGDPEAQVILPLLKDNWVDVFKNIAEGHLYPLSWKNEFVSVVVAVSEGYPKSFQKGIPLHGDLWQDSHSQYFLYAGIKKDPQGWVTSGGRVLNAVGIGKTKEQALKQSYQLLKSIHFQGMKYRNDIGHIFL